MKKIQKINKINLKYSEMWVPPITVISPIGAIIICMTKFELFIVDSNSYFKSIEKRKNNNYELKNINGFVFPNEFIGYSLLTKYKMITKVDTIFSVINSLPIENSSQDPITYYISLIHHKILTKQQLEHIEFELLKEKVDTNKKYINLINNV